MASKRGLAFKFITGAVCIIVCILILLFVWDLAASHTRHRKDAEYYGAQNAAREEQRIKERCGAATTTGLVDCAVEIVNSSREQQRSEEDLQVQRDMSEWAFLSLIISSFGMVASIVGIFFVARTLNLSEKTSHAQTRAYVVAETCKVRLFNGKETRLIAVDVVFRNCGTTPAYNVDIAHEILIAGKAESLSDFDAGSFAPVGVIGPSIGRLIKLESNFIPRKVDVLSVLERNSKLALVARGIVRYKTVEVTRQTSFCFEIPHNSLSYRELDGELQMTRAGNTAT